MFHKALDELWKKMQGKAPVEPSTSLSKEENEDPESEEVIDILSFINENGIEDKDKKSEKEYNFDSPFAILKEVVQHQEPDLPPVDLSGFEEPEEESAGADEILAYIDKHGIEIKSDDQRKRDSREAQDTYLNKKRMEKRIDLHGLTIEEADLVLRQAFESAEAEGIRQLLIIHGRGKHSITQGGAKLKGWVREKLTREYEYRIEGFKYVSGGEGGDGATRVFLKT